MGLIRDSFELKEAKALLARLLSGGKPESGPEPEAVQEVPEEEAMTEAIESEPETIPEEVPAGTAPEAPREALPDYGEQIHEGTRLERIEATLGLMCERGGFDSGALVGGDGLVVASHDVYFGEAEVARLCAAMTDLLDRLGLTVGAPDDVPMTVSLGGVTACILVMETGGATFSLAGFSSSGQPDPHELSAAAAHITGLLGRGQ